MAGRPLISFVICTHRAPDSIFSTLDSLFKQSDWESSEVVIVNNGFSSDRETELRRYAERQNRGGFVRFVQEPKPGLGFARLKGFSTALGDWLVLLDDDNTVDREFLKELLSILSENPKVLGISAVVTPVWETRPLAWLAEFGTTCLSYTHTEVPSERSKDQVFEQTRFSLLPRPPGGGMIIHKSVALFYQSSATNEERVALGRTGDSLVGCEDEDMWRGIQKMGGSGLLTNRLLVYHHIPDSRLRRKYLLKLCHQMAWSYAVLEQIWNGPPRETRFEIIRGGFITLAKLGKIFLTKAGSNPRLKTLLLMARESGTIKGRLHRLKDQGRTN